MINAFVNRDVLQSNFGNSLAMYEIARIGEGFARVVELMMEGATPLIVAIGVVGLADAVVRRNAAAIPLLAVAAVFFLQFVLIGAGKPAEYGRFGLFTDATFAILTASVAASSRSRKAFRIAGLAILVGWVGISGTAYAQNFLFDARSGGSRRSVSEFLRDRELAGDKLGLDRCSLVVGVVREPAPYCNPPLNFSNVKVVLTSDVEDLPCEPGDCCRLILVLDEVRWADRTVPRFITRGPVTPISWANKPIELPSPLRAKKRGDFED